MVVDSRIGAIVLRTRGLTPSAPYSRGHWPLFRAKGGRSRGVVWEFRRLDDGALKRPPSSPEQAPVASECLSWGEASPLLGAPRVRRALAAAGKHPGLIAVECRPYAVTIMDFKTGRADVFYAEGQRSRRQQGGRGRDRRTGAARDAGREECILGAGLLAPFLPAHGAFLVHAAAVVAGGSVKAPKAGTAIRTKAGSGVRGGRGGKRAKAALFLAPDEGGKTTAARLAAAGIYSSAASSGSKTGRDDAGRALILGDDQVILRRERGRFWMHGTPWNLICGGPANAELGGMFLLEKADAFRISPLKASDAVSFIWNEHRHITDFLPTAIRKKAFALISEACASVPVYRLSFTKTALDWAAVLACLK